MNLLNSVSGIIVGVRFSRSFRIPDISGGIVDDILYSLDSPFGTKTFGIAQETSSREKLLINEKTQEFLSINTDDLIFSLKVNEDFNKKIDYINNEIIVYLKEKLFKKYEIKNINRLGIIFQHKLAQNSDFTEIIKVASKNEISSAENISLSFSKKLPTTDGILKKGVKDYRNVIFFMREVKKNFIINVDYQHYFDPIIEDFRDAKADVFINEGVKYLKDHAHEWISKYNEQ